MKHFSLSKLFVPVIVLLGLNYGALAQTTTFNFNGTPGVGASGINGTPQTYTVPAGVTKIAVDMWGGKGGWPCCTNNASRISFGGRVQCTMNVTPSSTLYIYVGGGGANNLNSGTPCPGGWNGGGIGAGSGPSGSGYAAAGGGATDIRTSTTGSYATSVLVVAGGGGGGGDFEPVGGAGGGATGGTGERSPGSTTGGSCGGGQTGPSCSTGYALGSQGQGADANNYSIGGGGGGWWGGNAGVMNNGAGGGGSSYPATPNSVVTAITHTPGYSGANGNGQVIITVLCTSPGTIVGATPVCVGGTFTLSNPTATGGIWTSSNPAVATINSSGEVNGVSAGTAIITYLQSNPCGGVSATTTVTINPPPGPITGISSICAFAMTTLNNASLGGTWASSNPSSVDIGATTGNVTGMAPGTAVITYTLPTGCLTTSTFTVNGAPLPITGPGAVCIGGTMTLSDAIPGGTWSSGTPSVATISPGAGIVTGVSAGTASITYTAPTGCLTSTIITVNPLPAPITGTANVCVGLTTTLINSSPGGSWTISNTALATIGAGSGVVTGISPGTPVVTYTLLSTGCKVTNPVLVTSMPLPVTGANNVCVGATTTLTNTGGGTWSSSAPSVASVGIVSGVVSGVSPGTAVITYMLPTGCSVNASMLVNPLPTNYALSGGGSYCAGTGGVHIGLVYSNAGINYQLYNSSLPVGTGVPGSNSGLDFGTFIIPGTYTVVANNPLTGCSKNMTGSVAISINPLPVAFDVTGGGYFCAGSAGIAVGLTGSEFGRKYQLYNGTTPVGSLFTGTGSPMNFGLFPPGTYTVWGINAATGCTAQMTGNADIIPAPVPTAYTVGGGGGYCAGGAGVPVLLSGSDPGSSYQVFNGGAVGSPITGTGGPLNFGSFTASGTYTVVVTDGGTGCTNNMLGSATISINPQPVAYTVTGGGNYCDGGTGVRVGLSFSSPGVNYQLWYNGSPIATVGGSGSGLDFGLQTDPGLYSVFGINSVSGCTNNMAGSVSIGTNPLPVVYNVTGGGSYCLGGTGHHIGLDMSDIGINYQMYRGTTPVGFAVGGTGGALDFGAFTTSGIYTLVATNATTGCAANQSGSAVITINPLPSFYNVTGGGSYCAGGAGVAVGLSGSSIGITYELMSGGSTTGLILPGTGAALDFGTLMGAGFYTVVATDDITGCVRNMLGSATITIMPLPNIFNVTGGGVYCLGGTGVHIGLDGTNAGISYRLHNTSGPVGPAYAGTGGALDFGLKTVVDNYTVIATNLLTTCAVMMNGGAAIMTNPLPADYAITGGGNYCAGGAGVNAGIGYSDFGVEYELFRGGVSTGIILPGAEIALDFGPQTAGVYNIVARDVITGCTRNMPGSVIVNAISPASFTVTGGGSYCTGGIGVHVGLSGSEIGVDYQLYSSGAPGLVISGTGAPLDFGLETTAGIDSVVATNVVYSCMKTMTGTATIGINPLPVIYNVTGGGRFCAGSAGVHIGLDNSGTGIRYQLFNGTSATGAPVTGTGAALDFGAFTAGGTYTVIATNIATLCSENMAASAVITVNPLPTPYVVKITGANPAYPGYYCASDTGVHIYLPGSDAGINYQLYRGSAMVGSPVAGTGASIDFGLHTVSGGYTVVGTESVSGGCINNMAGTVNVTIIPLPTVYNVTGGGNFCEGTGGVHIGLDESDLGIYYQLYRGTSKVGSRIYGDNYPIDFGLKDTAGTYTVVANSAITACPNNMLGSATVVVDAILTPVVTIQAYPGVGINVWHVDSLRAFVTNAGTPTYQWVINGHIIAGETNASFTRHEFFDKDSVACVVTAHNSCGGNTTSKSVIILLHNVGVAPVAQATSDIRLMPNPNKGTFTVKGTTGATDNHEVFIEVTNMLGQVVYRNKVTAQNGSIDEQIQLSSNLANGMYMLNLRSGSENKVFHFVVEQ